MKKRVKHIAVAQCGKMLAAVYFVISLRIVAIMMLFALAGTDAPSVGVGMLILFPIIYAVGAYVAGVLSAWIYNIVAGRLGGIEYTTTEMAP